MRPLLLLPMLLLPTAAQAELFVSKVDNEAKGEKTCMVLDPHQDVFAYVWPGGGVGLQVTADLYPGSTLYFLIGDERVRGPAALFVDVPAEQLAEDPVIKYSYTAWPTRGEVMGEAVLEGFSAAYQQCVEFLG